MPPIWALSGAAVGALKSEGMPALSLLLLELELELPHADKTAASAKKSSAGTTSLSLVNRIFRSFRLG
ncbi:MAG TPA: hypothetical protein VI159_08475 [Gemmatimonadales bacterium]